jgi:large subunit ribosomal protein L29
MKAADMRKQPTEELQQKHDLMLEEYFGLRIKHALGQLENPLVLRMLRRDIARARTLLTERGVEEKTRRRRRTTATAARTAGARDKGREEAKAGSAKTGAAEKKAGKAADEA